MEKRELERLLKGYKSGEVELDQVMDTIKQLPFEDLGYAKLDHHRAVRNGFPEVVYCEGKELIHVKGIMETLLKKDHPILATRASREVYEFLKDLNAELVYHPVARIITYKLDDVKKSEFKVAVVSGGTSDIPVAEEACITAEILGCDVERIYDVGVAGIHRLLAQVPKLNEASIVIAIAGMEGALASVVGGLVDVPVLAVPTSVGYGTSFNGLSALLTMLNSCASGVSVMNIDNGFGAGYLAATYVRQMEAVREKYNG